MVRSVAAIDGTALKILREKDGYTRTAFAETIGISLSYLCDIEEGRRTLKRNPELLGRFADALNVPRSMLERNGAAA
jgi:transcriptional regulator with XRE-family HTH domain